MKTIIKALLGLSICSGILSAQDMQFQNRNQNLLGVNPSFAGSNGFIRSQLSLRSEGPNSFNTMSAASIDAYVKPLGAGLGVMASDTRYRLGMSGQQDFSLIYAQHLKTKNEKWLIIPSVQITYARRTIDYSSWYLGSSTPTFTWNNPAALPSSVKSYADFSTGLLLNYAKDFFIGFSANHINQPDGGLLGTSKLAVRYNFHTSYSLRLNDLSFIQLAYYFHKQGFFSHHQLRAVALLSRHFIAGAGYNNSDNAILLAGLRNNYLMFQLSYDLGFSRLAGYYDNSWELHLSLNIRDREKRKDITVFERM